MYFYRIDQLARKICDDHLFLISLQKKRIEQGRTNMMKVERKK